MSKTNEQLAIELARVEGNLRDERAAHNRTRTRLMDAKNRIKVLQTSTWAEQNLSRVASAKRTVEDFLRSIEEGESSVVQDTLKAMVRRDLEQINA